MSRSTNSKATWNESGDPRKGHHEIFVDPLTTAAAIDRVVHYSIIIEFGHEMKSVRAEEAARRNGIQLDGTIATQEAES
jgi:hypothetical protein